MKKLIAGLAIALLLASPAYAQKTKAQLTTEVNANFPDNTTGLITPAIQRTTLIDMINSWYGLIDATNNGTGQVTAGGFAGSSVPAASVLSLSGQYTQLQSTDGVQMILMGVADPTMYFRATTFNWQTPASTQKMSLSTGATPLLTVGAAGLAPGQLALAGTIGGAVTFAAPGTTTSWNFNLPVNAGSAGQALVSGGGGGTAMTWSSTAITLPNFIGGLILSNDGGSPNTVLDIAAGTATDTTQATYMTIAAFTKSTGGAWAAGSGNNGMGNGLTVAVNTWYHACLANNAGAPDIYFDTSATCANRPVGIADTKIRRLGSFKTAAGTTNILAFVQNNDTFLLGAQVPEFGGAVVNPGTTAVTRTLAGVPTGVVVEAFLNWDEVNGSNNHFQLISPLAIPDVAATATAFTIDASISAGNSHYGSNIRILTNTSAQFRTRQSASGASDQFIVTTSGWRDFRGQ